MHIPKFWAHNDDGASPPDGPTALRCWRWSDVSVDDARRQAETRGAELAAMLKTGMPLDRYLYGDRPMREQIVQTIGGGGDGGGGRGGQAAVITRNLYGALVLNAARAMFIDVDFPATPRPSAGLLGRLFKRSSADDRESMPLERIRIWATRQRNLGLRIYRTCAGLRCLVISRTFDPASDESLTILRETGSDPLYIRLCQFQACFRARLTPKPWRCQIRHPPPRYPWAGAVEESRFHEWKSTYDRATRPFVVCRFLEQIGAPQTHPEIAPIVQLHDQYTCGDPARPLA